MISVQNLSKTYKSGKIRVNALNDVTFSVGEGEVVGFIGPNGAGKTTLMECLLGLVWPTKGAILVDGRNPTHLKARRSTAFMPERPQYDNWMTPREFLRYQYLLCNQPAAEAKERVEQSLDIVELDEKARNRRIQTFSKGMLQRVGLAQVMIGDPRYCFLDEPTSGLDPIGRNVVRDVIRRWKSENRTVILNSHNLDEVERVCDRVVFINGGKITLVGTGGTEDGSSVHARVVWSGPDDVLKRLNEIAQQSSLPMSETEINSCTFTLVSKQQLPTLVRSLVNAQIDVEEIYIERNRLGKLFEDVSKREGGE